jgi:hypothetical protein
VHYIIFFRKSIATLLGSVGTNGIFTIYDLEVAILTFLKRNIPIPTKTAIEVTAIR